MNDKKVEADKNQPPQKESSQAADESRRMFTKENPPEEQWATCQIIKDGQVVESFKVPFTQEEVNLIMMLREKKNDPGLKKGYADGGPEREHIIALQIPYQHGLDDRIKAIDMLRRTAHNADKILTEGIFTPSLNSREPIQAIRDALSSLI